MKYLLGKKFISFLLLLCVATAAYVPNIFTDTTRSVKTAHAQVPVAGVGPADLQTAAQTGITSLKTTISAASDLISSAGITSLVTKEFALDGIANSIVKMMLQQMTASILQWINSGFEGSPAFVTDLKGLLRDVANETADQFISNITSKIDSQFGLDIQSALARQYYGGQDFNIQTTLDNPEQFFSGQDDGSWGDWLRATQDTGNTELGQYLRARDEMSREISEAIGRELTQLDWGDGTKSKEYCQTVEGENGSEENCQITMPGKQISDQLSFELSVGGRTLIEADEINEIISALLAQLAQQAITGIGGLLGLSDSGYSGGGYSGGGYGGGSSYLDQLAAETASSTAETTYVVEEALRVEREYRIALLDAIDRINQIDEENEENDDEYGRCYSLDLPTELNVFRRNAETAVTESDENVAALVQIIDELEDSDTTPERKQEILTIFQENQVNGVLHNRVDIAELENEIRELEVAIEEFEDEMDDEIALCD